MAGKYADVSKTLPKRDSSFFDDDAKKFQKRVDDAKTPIIDRRPGALAAAYKDARARKEIAKDALATINVSVAALEQLIWDALEDQGLQSVKIEGGGSFSVNPAIAVRVENRHVFEEWIDKNDLSGLRKIPSATIVSIVKERLLEKLDVPPGVIVSTYSETSFRKE
jgi:hypothetical protein